MKLPAGQVHEQGPGVMRILESRINTDRKNAKTRNEFKSDATSQKQKDKMDTGLRGLGIESKQ